jgi:ParB-like chromosome segregation protein Spo0J
MELQMKISELTQDDKNANRGTSRGREAVKYSIEEYGTGRSILIDRNGNIIAGNKTTAAAIAAGIEEVVVVKTTGDQLVAVMRTDLELDDPAARELAIADNRTAELGLVWDPVVMAELSGELDLTPFWTDDELKAATGEGLVNAVSPIAPAQGAYSEQFGIIVICKDEADQRKVYEKLTGDGFACRVVVT